MLIVRDLPLMLALFAFMFGVLGFLVSGHKLFKQTMPHLRRNSFLYLLCALLLTGAFLLMNRLSPQALISSELALLQMRLERASLTNVLIQPVVETRPAQLVLVEPKLELAFNFATVKLVSDPTNANVFIEGGLRGQTPLELIVPVNQDLEYQLSREPNTDENLRYQSYEGVLNVASDSEISVWLERSSD